MQTVLFQDIHIGDRAQSSRLVTPDDIRDFARVSGDDNPVHLSESFARATPFGGVIAHGMLAVSFVSALVGTQYPGPGTIFLGLNRLNFLEAVRPGDTVTSTVTVAKKHAAKPIVTFDCVCTNQHGKTVLTAEIVVKAPLQRPALPPPSP